MHIKCLYPIVGFIMATFNKVLEKESTTHVRTDKICKWLFAKCGLLDGPAHWILTGWDGSRPFETIEQHKQFFHLVFLFLI